VRKTYRVDATVRAVLEEALAELGSLGREGAGEEECNDGKNAGHGGSGGGSSRTLELRR
jgi:hypothetical protein